MTDERQEEPTAAHVRADALAAVAAAIHQEAEHGGAVVAMAFLRLVAEHPDVLDAGPEALPERPAEVEDLVQLAGYPSARVRARVYGRR